MPFVSYRCSLMIVGLALALASAPARAQDFTAGKTPPQLFASDCSACHKYPHGLAKGKDVRNLTHFLVEHYTTKPQSASALAGFLASVANQKPPAPEKPPEAATTDAKPGGPAVAAAHPASPGDAEELNPMQPILRAYAAYGEGASERKPPSPAESYAHSGEGAAPAREGAPAAAQAEPAGPSAAANPASAPNESTAAKPATPAAAAAPAPAASGAAPKKKPAPAAPAARRVEPPLPVGRDSAY